MTEPPVNQAKKIYIATSSPCRVNNLDSERIKEFFRLNGHQVVNTAAEADLTIVNTCGHRKERVCESIDLIKKVKHEMSKKGDLLVCGCLPATNNNKLRTVFKGTSLTPFSYAKFDDIIKARIKFSQTRASYSLDKNTFCIPVCKGCTWNCSYCTIKKARGTRLQSRQISDIMKDVKTALRDGYKNIELQGEDVGAYGRDIGTTFPVLLKKIICVNNDFNVNIFRVNPYWLVKYFDVLKKPLRSPKAASISVPIQSGSDRILKRMNRPYRIKDVKDCLVTLRKESSHLRIYTDMIVGFPGEKNEDFQRSLNLIKEINFDFVYLYPFSRSKDCAAYKYSDLVRRHIIKKRTRKLENEVALGLCVAQYKKVGASDSLMDCQTM